MSDLLDQLITPEVRVLFYLFVACVVALGVLVIARLIRGRNSPHDSDSPFG